MPDHDQVSGELLEFVSACVGRVLTVDDDYFELGLADSLFSLELVTFVESRFTVVVEVDDLDLNNFRTVERLTEFVLKKSATAVLDRP
jgi:acyl carrier protein